MCMRAAVQAEGASTGELWVLCECNDRFGSEINVESIFLD